jgi:sulfite dehydrogenase (cytochrome) subunit B
MKKIFIPFLLLVIVAGLACAAEKDAKSISLPDIQTQLEPGEGQEKVAALCNICHSVDYITTQPKGSKAQWLATVTKMRKVFGAPILDADADVIVKYLAVHYGNGK